VTLFAQRVTGPAPAGVEVIHLDPGALPRGTAGEEDRIRAIRRFAGRAGTELDRLRPDLVYERLSLFFDAGQALAERCGAMRLVEVNAPVTAERARHLGLLNRFSAERAERAALAGARVLAVSPTLAEWARHRGAAHAEVVSNGVDCKRFSPERCGEDGRRLRDTLGLEEAEVIGFVGSLKPWHGVDVLLEAAALLAARRPALRVLIVGEGPGRSALEKQAAGPVLRGRVVFTGAVPQAGVPVHLAALDIATAPFLPHDDFYFSPLKVVEAMAAARPIVASAFPPIERMLRGAGVLVPPGSAPALAEALSGLLEDPAAAAGLGHAARAVAVSRHGWDEVARRILAAAAPHGASTGGVRPSPAAAG